MHLVQDLVMLVCVSREEAVHVWSVGGRLGQLCCMVAVPLEVSCGSVV